MSDVVSGIMIVAAAMLTAGCGSLGGPEVNHSWGTPADDIPVWHGSLVLEVDYELTGTLNLNLAARVTAHNVGQRGLSAGVKDGGCSLELRAYPTPERDGEPLWQGSARGWACPDVLVEIELPPGGSSWVGTTLVPYSVLPSGTTYFSARVIFVDPDVRTGELPAGEVRKD